MSKWTDEDKRQAAIVNDVIEAMNRLEYLEFLVWVKKNATRLRAL